jgi:hypothetical protein
VLLNTVSKKHFLQYCFPSMTIWSTIQFLNLCRTGFEVLTVAVIHCMFWLGQCMASYIGMNVLERHFWFCLSRPLEDTSIMPTPKPQYPQISLHCPIILKTKHLNLNILLFPCIVSLFIVNQQHAHIRQKIVLCCT